MKIRLSTAIFLLIAIILGLFYWFFYRPAEIRKKCIGSGYLDTEVPHSIFSGGMTKDRYNSCLIRNGLKPEL